MDQDVRRRVRAVQTILAEVFAKTIVVEDVIGQRVYVDHIERLEAIHA